ncbi:AraC family transcriptional regulator [Streptosporangiaceae bacterium NEAU-GS5]|nr:AraC family transcriptional regulator [Streptosporangiaceae bacterium NEAU-GS5]
MPSEYLRWRPSAALRPYVAWFSGYRESDIPPATHRGLPSPYLTMIVTLDDPLVLTAHSDGSVGRRAYDTLIGGLHVRPALIVHDGRQSGIQFAVTPLGARALLGLPAGELSHIDVLASDVLGSFALELRERALAGAGWTSVFQAVERALLSRVTDLSLPPEVAYAWRRILVERGRTPVEHLAAEVGWSSRHLRQRFRAEIGLGPKEAAQVVRFDHARRLLLERASSGEPYTLASVASDCGYYDQSHLDREFAAFAGCPPTRWLAEEFRIFQAMDIASGEQLRT